MIFPTGNDIVSSLAIASITIVQNFFSSNDLSNLGMGLRAISVDSAVCAVDVDIDVEKKSEKSLYVVITIRAAEQL